MRVKVTPPYEGAGSWEAEVVSKKPVKIAMDDKVITAHLLKGGVQVPASWCEPISEITPEPGDICEVWDSGAMENCRFLGFYSGQDNNEGKYPVATVPGSMPRQWGHCRVLARKPKGYEDAWQAILAFVNVWDTSAPVDRKQAAYETFLRAILGGAEYGRVGG